MVGDLQGRTALVTGGAKRLGRAVALGLARAGANVVLHYRSSEAEVREAVRELEGIGVRAWAVRADLRDEAQAVGMVDEALRLAGPLTILINSASTYPPSRLETLTRAELDANIDISAWAPFVVARRLATAGEGGHVVNFLDTRVVGHDSQHVGYHAAKVLFALLTREMALRWAPCWQVNGVAPGLILPPAGTPPDDFARLKDTVPLERTGGPADIVDAVLYLVRSRFVTGQVLFVDGGRHLREANRG